MMQMFGKFLVTMIPGRNGEVRLENDWQLLVSPCRVHSSDILQREPNMFTSNDPPCRVLSRCLGPQPSTTSSHCSGEPQIGLVR